MSERNVGRHADLLAAAARAALVELKVPLEEKQLPPLSRAALHLLEIAVELYEESRRSASAEPIQLSEDEAKRLMLSLSSELQEPGTDRSGGSGGGT